MADKLPSFYTVIPAYVRYNQKLTDFDKLLYGEIAALTNANNYCWASNRYFMKVFTKSESTITRSIARLNDSGVISTTYNNENGTQRILRLKQPVVKNDYPRVGKNDDPRARPKNTRNNNTRYNNKYSRPDVNVEWFNDYLKDNENDN